MASRLASAGKSARNIEIVEIPLVELVRVVQRSPVGGAPRRGAPKVAWPKQGFANGWAAAWQHRCVRKGGRPTSGSRVPRSWSRLLTARRADQVLVRVCLHLGLHRAPTKR